MKKVLWMVIAFGLHAPAFGQLTVNNGVTPTQLVNNFLLGAGVTATNITYTGAAISRSSFNCSGPCNLGISTGILLSTGEAIAPTAPASYHHSTDVGAAGDAQLNAIVTPRLTEDAAILEFDFSVASDSVKFEYVFASEEYNDYANTNFNDVFAFFISGPGIVGSQNIALIPGTATPVSINTVNNGNSGGVSTGPCMNCAYFVDNVGGASVYFDGFTTVLRAQAAVQPCQTYHIKLAIADAGDGVFDSGVFLEGGSFSSLGQITLFANNIPQPNNATVYACTGTSVNLCLNPSPNYNWSTGASTQCITVNEQNLVPGGNYQAYVSSLNGCFAFSTTVNVQFVTPTATITPSGPVDLCPGGNVTLTANAGNSYLWSNGATTQSINVSTAGTYTVTVSNGPSCSAVSTPVTVTVGSATAQINGVLSLCSGSNTTLTANAGQSYLWSTGASTQSINVTTAGNYTVTVTQAGGCSASATVAVQVNTNPVPAITGILSICQGTSTTLDAGAGFASYLWSNGAVTQTLSASASGTYTVTVTNAAGCSGSTSAAVVVNPLPTPAIAGTLAFCSGSNSNLNAGAGYSSYLWSTGASTQIINVTTAGNYAVTVTDPNGCSASTNAVVTVNPLPNPNITGVFAFCQGSNTSLNAGGGFSNYLWSTGATTQNITVTSGNTYTVTVTDANGCSNSDNQLVTVNPNPAPAISGVNTICQGANTTFTADPGFSNYLWSTGSTAASVSLSAAGTYTVTVTDANGCTGTASYTLTVNPLPTPAISGTLTFCSGNNSNLNAGGGYTSYLWSTGASTQIINVTSGGNYVVTVTNANGCSASTNAVVNVNPLPAPNITGVFAFCQGGNTTLNAGGGYSNYLWSTGATTQNITVAAGNTYTVTVTDANGCSNNDAQLVTVNANPVPAISGVNTICQGSNTLFTADPGYSGYLWSTGSTSAALNVNTAGTYTVTVTDANGCTGTASYTLTVNPLPTPAITGTLAFCSGNNSNLNAGGGYSSYLWSTGASTQIINVTSSGNYVVTVTNANGCSASTNAVVTVNPLPAPNISGVFAFCQGGNTTLNAGGGYSNYLWNTGATTQNITVSAGNTYTVTVTDANGCSGNDAQLVTVNANPVPAISGVNTICQGSNTLFTADPGYSGYLWSTGSTSAALNVNTAGTYTVTVTDANGCTGTASYTLTVNPIPAPAITGITSFCQGGNSNLNAGAGFSSYLWSTGATTQVVNVTTSGNYVVTVTNGFGCSASVGSVVTVNPLPAPSISGLPAICIGSSATWNAGGGYASYLWNNGATSQTINVTSAGSYTVTVTSAAGCSGSTTSALTVNPLPTPSISGITAVCQGATTTFDAGAGYSAYLWSNGSTAQTISPGTAGTYTVTVTDNNGCQNNTNIALTVNPLPVPAITGTTAFCQGDNSNLNAGAGFTSYLWSTGATSQVINVTSAGNYIVTVTDNNGCSANTSSQITVHPNPVPVINGGTGICQGTSTTLSVPGNYASYLWSTGSTTQNISVSTAGNYAVTVASAFGCTGSASTSMVINPLPSPVITGITAICQGTTTAFDAGAGYSAYLWSNGATTQTINPGVAGTYTVTVTDNNGCQNNTNIALTVNPLPTPAITGDFEFCIGESSNISAGAGYSGYLWSDGSTSQSISVSTAGSYSVTVTDGNGCSASTSTSIIVNPLPTPAITGVSEICQGTTTVFSAGNYASYMWSTGETTSSITIGLAGVYEVTVTDANGCVNNTTATLTVNELPTATISGVDAICIGESSVINFSFTGEAPFVFTYAAAGNALPPVTMSSLSGTIGVTPGTTTAYTLISISDANCQGVVGGSALVTVNPLPEPEISGDLAICDGETTTLTATPGFVSYNWSNAGTTPSVNTGNAGIYTVTVTDLNGCVGTSPAVNLVVNMVPVVAFTNDTSLTCEIPEINFTNLSQYEPGSSFVWTFGDGGSSTLSNPSHLYFAPGNYPVSLVITTPAGCTSSSSYPVDIMFYPLPVADFVTAPAVTNVFNGKVDFVDRSDYAVSWYWEFSDGAKSVEQNPSHYFNEVGEYRIALTVANIAGCTDRYEDVVTINPFYIPNAFSPNGDGVNDEFYYSGYDLDVASYHMRIFNRWGQLVFTGEDENDNWNGITSDGSNAPQGTYVYRLQVKTKGGKEHTFSGQVNLIR